MADALLESLPDSASPPLCEDSAEQATAALSSASAWRRCGGARAHQQCASEFHRLATDCSLLELDSGAATLRRPLSLLDRALRRAMVLLRRALAFALEALRRSAQWCCRLRLASSFSSFLAAAFSDWETAAGLLLIAPLLPFLLVVLALRTPSSPTARRVSSALEVAKISSKSATHSQPRVFRHVVFVVVGDIGRSPRIAYAASSLLAEPPSPSSSEEPRPFFVHIVAYDEAPLPAALAEAESAKRLLVHPLRRPRVERLRSRLCSFPLGRLVFWAAKGTEQCFSLTTSLAELFFSLRSTGFGVTGRGRLGVAVLQNPPGFPGLWITQACCRLFGLGFVVDWHNFTHAALFHVPNAAAGRAEEALSFRKRTFGLARKAAVRASARLEFFVGRRADASLCVSRLMQSQLSAKGLRAARLLRDRPASALRPLSLWHRHSVALAFLSLSSPEDSEDSEESEEAEGGRCCRAGGVCDGDSAFWRAQTSRDAQRQLLSRLGRLLPDLPKRLLEDAPPTGCCAERAFPLPICCRREPLKSVLAQVQREAQSKGASSEESWTSLRSPKKASEREGELPLYVETSPLTQLVRCEGRADRETRPRRFPDTSLRREPSFLRRRFGDVAKKARKRRCWREKKRGAERRAAGVNCKFACGPTGRASS